MKKNGCCKARHLSHASIIFPPTGISIHVPMESINLSKQVYAILQLSIISN